MQKQFIKLADYRKRAIMDLMQMFKSFLLALTIFGLLFFTIRETLRIYRDAPAEGSYRILLTAGLVASLVSDLVSQINLLLSVAACKWL